MGCNKPNSWDNKMCFVRREWWRSDRAHLCYSSVTEGPFHRAKCSIESSDCLVITSFVRSNFWRFVDVKKKKKLFSLYLVICISLNLQRLCSHFPSLFSAIINQWPSARDQTGMNASTKCSFLRHPGKWLPLVTNPKPIYSSAMDWSTYYCRSSASPRHTRSACSVNQIQDIAPWACVMVGAMVAWL